MMGIACIVRELILSELSFSGACVGMRTDLSKGMDVHLEERKLHDS
jgi:hypothetical protein